jgi:hypothetical protein
MKLIATEYPPIEDGVYSATLLQIEQREPGEQSTTGKLYFALEVSSGA